MAKRIPAGQMRHTVKIQAYSTGLDTYGQSSTAGLWNDCVEVRAKISPLRGNEAILARQVYPSASHSIMIDYLSTMDTTGATQLRVLYGSRAMNIGAILNPDEENWQMELLCGEER